MHPKQLMLQQSTNPASPATSSSNILLQLPFFILNIEETKLPHISKEKKTT